MRIDVAVFCNPLPRFLQRWQDRHEEKHGQRQDALRKKARQANMSQEDSLARLARAAAGRAYSLQERQGWSRSRATLTGECDTVRGAGFTDHGTAAPSGAADGVVVGIDNQLGPARRQVVSEQHLVILLPRRHCTPFARALRQPLPQALAAAGSTQIQQVSQSIRKPASREARFCPRKECG